MILPRNHPILFPSKVFLRVYAPKKQSYKLTANMFPESFVNGDAGKGGVVGGEILGWEWWDARNEMAGLLSIFPLSSLQ